jgi:hypothetical protein
VALHLAMAQPRKYSTDADRYRAYRERKRERVEALAREVEILNKAQAGKRTSQRGPKLTMRSHLSIYQATAQQ